ncbi:MAG: type II secretion system protein [Verrucomicrobia bacterium]|nr:type II secretion system protein [Verrucomicrobiota bacterium]
MIRQTRCARRGFTLVELLVVITIIGLLASMVLVGMPMIRERGSRAHCSNNLKQIWMTLNSYAQDNEDRLPYTGAAGDSANKHFGLMLPRWLRDERIFICRSASTRGYRADGRIDEEPQGMARTESLKPGENCYAYAFNLGGPATQDSPLACDQLAMTGLNNQGWKRVGMGSNHGKDGGNVLYMDGHVEFMSATTEGFWPPRRPKIKAMEKGQAREPANAERAENDAG